jgi:hypothetical protein
LLWNFPLTNPIYYLIRIETVPFIRVNEIHALEPSRQPIAWLDVMASANTTRDEKNEAMEEIMMFAKDKVKRALLVISFLTDTCMYTPF